jgi:hypothetical protein
LEEHLLCKERVRSSSLLVSTNPPAVERNEDHSLLTAHLTTELKIG